MKFIYYKCDCCNPSIRKPLTPLTTPTNKYHAMNKWLGSCYSNGVPCPPNFLEEIPFQQFNPKGHSCQIQKTLENILELGANQGFEIVEYQKDVREILPYRGSGSTADIGGGCGGGTRDAVICNHKNPITLKLVLSKENNNNKKDGGGCCKTTASLSGVIPMGFKRNLKNKCVETMNEIRRPCKNKSICCNILGRKASGKNKSVTVCFPVDFGVDTKSCRDKSILTSKPCLFNKKLQSHCDTRDFGTCCSRHLTILARKTCSKACQTSILIRKRSCKSIQCMPTIKTKCVEVDSEELQPKCRGPKFIHVIKFPTKKKHCRQHHHHHHHQQQQQKSGDVGGNKCKCC